MGFKNIYFNLFNNRNRKASIQSLIHKSGMRIIFPFYHVVSDDKVSHVQPLYKVKKVGEFISDLNFLLENYSPLNINDFQVGNYDADKNYFVLSFDDGLQEMATTVMPILQQMNISATFFLNTDFVDNNALFYRYKAALLIDGVSPDLLAQKITESITLNKVKIANPKTYLLQLNWSDANIIDLIAEKCNFSFNDYLRQQQPYLTALQVESLVEAGFTVGAHSLNHPLYSTINPQLQFIQTRDSMRIVNESFHPQFNYFAFPFTADGVVKELFPAMYGELNIHKSFGTAGLQKQKIANHIERIPAEHEKFSLEEIIRNEYHYYLFKNKLGK